MLEEIFSSPFIKHLDMLSLKEDPEPNFFDVGGCGYLENPISDLMALFMGCSPHVKPWLLYALLDILDIDFEEIDPATIYVEREATSKDGYRLDLVIKHDDFIIGIENKVYAYTYNPFSCYEDILKGYIDNNQCIYKCIIKPECNNAPGYNNWKVITYTNLVNSALSNMGNDFIKTPLTKWNFFYKEFLSHLTYLDKGGYMNNKLSNKDIDFIINNYNLLLKSRDVLSSFEHTIRNEAIQIVSQTLASDRIKTNLNSLSDNYKALYIKPDCWGGGDTGLTLSYGPSDDTKNLVFYVDGWINKKQYTDLASLKEEIERDILINAFIKSASNDDCTIEINKNKTGTYLYLSFWGATKDKNGAMNLLRDMAKWINDKIKK